MIDPTDVPFGAGPDPRDDVVMQRRYVSPAPGTSPDFERPRPHDGPRLSIALAPGVVSEQFIAQALLQLGAEDDLVRFHLALESCIGRQWVEEGDPDEHVISFEPIELAQDDSEAYGYREETEHGHADWFAFVPLGDVLLLLTMPQKDVEQQFDEAMLNQLLARAVARAESVIDD